MNLVGQVGKPDIALQLLPEGTVDQRLNMNQSRTRSVCVLQLVTLVSRCRRFFAIHVSLSMWGLGWFPFRPASSASLKRARRDLATFTRGEHPHLQHCEETINREARAVAQGAHDSTAWWNKYEGKKVRPTLDDGGDTWLAIEGDIQGQGRARRVLGGKRWLDQGVLHPPLVVVVHHHHPTEFGHGE